QRGPAAPTRDEAAAAAAGPACPAVLRERAFVDLASRCQAVICCRVTPKQKALVVALVKKYQQVVTLAIGDGANDVNMIKTADIGVGLAGQEGMQAVQNSDYVLAQFRFLQRLLLVHGRWSYVRTCKFLRYFIYKTLASMMAQVWFAFYSGFTAQPLYEGWFLALFNLLYSTLPVLYIGLFEQDVSAERSLGTPELYVAGQRDELFNYRTFLQALAHGTATSLVNFFGTLFASRAVAGPSGLSDHQSFAVVVALSGLLSVTVEVMLIIKYWTVLSVAAIALSLAAYAVLTWASQSYLLFKVSPTTFPFLYADRNVLAQPSILLVVLLNVALNTLPTLALRLVLQELQTARRKKAEEDALREEIFTVEPMPHLRRESRGRRSSYAFSHREGYANLITQGTSLRRAAGDNGLPYEAVASDQRPETPTGAAWPPREPSVPDTQPLGGAAVQEAPPPSLSSFTTLDEGSAAGSEPQAGASAVRSWSAQDRGPRTRDGSPSPQQPRAPLGDALAPSLPTESSGSRLSALSSVPDSGRASPESGSWFWRNPLAFWKSRQSAWLGNAREDAEPPPAGPGEPPAGGQPMEVEPWPVERQPSPMEWLPVPADDQPAADLSRPPPPLDGQAPCSCQPAGRRPPPNDRGSAPFPFANKPGSA
ncbi:phospholipid-transporting ATPase IK-like, partial [Oryctolagus cuniculus]|uniref:phospholipid-transporting ATPase IK-like n=1 Tax=Oryctolagus cuniculus TaxID=9986 RepID=UPI00387A07A8